MGFLYYILESISFCLGFMYFWAWVFVIATTLTALLKHERPESSDEQPEGVIDTYKMLWKIIKLPAVMKYCALLLTCKVSLSSHLVLREW